MMHDWHDRYDHGFRMGHWLIGAPIMILVWGLVIWALVLLLRNRGSVFGATKSSSPTPKQILDERLARGEIDAKDYKARLEVLNSNRD